MIGEINIFETSNNVDTVLAVDNLVDNEDILISFVVPTFNRLSTLKDTIDSIALLDGLDSVKYEILVIDNSADISEENKSLLYCQKKNIKQLRYYVNCKNLGMEGNWNRGIKLAKGKYISMLHDDDLLTNTYLLDIMKCIRYLENRNVKVGFIKTKIQYFHELSEIHKNKFAKCMVLHSLSFTDALFRGMGLTQIPSCGIIFNRAALIEVGGFDVFLHPSADQVMGVKIIRKGYKGFSTDRILGYYRIGINESLKNNTVQQFVIKDDLIRDYIYNKDIFSKCFGKVFGNYQYSLHITDLMKYYNEDYGMSLDIKDLDYRNSYKEYGPMMHFAFNSLKKMCFMMKSNRIMRCQ